MANRDFIPPTEALALWDRVEARLRRLQTDLREKCDEATANLLDPAFQEFNAIRDEIGGNGENPTHHRNA